MGGTHSAISQPSLPHFTFADIDECKEGATCPTLRDCVNTDGGHTCNCSSGFKENVETGNCEGEVR